MLFDLRGRGRRRTIQVIYLSLALLIGGGLIFFGVGGAGVGLLNSNDNGGAVGGGGDVIAKRLQKTERAVRAHPRDAAAWAQLARLRFQNAEFDQNTNRFTAKGKQQLASAARAWDRYLTLKQQGADATLARLMANAFAPDALNRPRDEVAALEIVAQGQPSGASFAQLAVAAYQAGQLRKGDLAAREALRRSTKDNRTTLRAQFDAAKRQAVKGQTGSGGAPASG
jgi:hypothetical protein